MLSRVTTSVYKRRLSKKNEKRMSSKSRKIIPSVKHLTLRNFSNLAEAAKETGKLQEAEDFFRTAYLGKVKILGKYHPECLTALHNLALILELKRKFDDSIEIFKEALSSREQILGKNHPSTCSTAFCLGDLYRKLGRHETAQEMFEYSYNGYINTLGAQDRNTKLVKSRLKALKNEEYFRKCVVS
jgi:tetratricopeptide (TPR) repeat protein